MDPIIQYILLQETAPFHVGRSKIHGKGTLANLNLTKGVNLGIAFKKVRNTGNPDRDYTRTDLGTYTNHDKKPNVKIVATAGKTYSFVVIKPISKGKEIFINYKEIPWEGKQISEKMIDPITQYILNEASNESSILYHASDRLKKILEPRKSGVGTLPKKAKKNIDYETKDWERKAVYAAPKEIQVIPFGLERINMMFPGLRTEEEVNRLKKSCYFSVNKKTNILQVHYWNHTPTKPIYIYTVERKNFKPILANKGGAVDQWYSTRMVTPIEMKKIFPNQVKRSWRKISDAQWEIKKQKYRIKGFYK